MIVMWAACEVQEGDVVYERRVFEVHGTGHPWEKAPGMLYSHVGTVQVMGGDLIWHVFEVFADTRADGVAGS